MCSAATIREGRSISIPPNSSGMVMPVSPSSADLRSTARAAPGCFSRMAGRLGSTSLVQNSSIMRPIARCSSVRSSAVNTWSGRTSSKRKAEPLVLPGVSVSVVMIPMPPFEINHLSSVKEFEGRELPPTDWLVLTQDRIQTFADATEDRQWIHVEPERGARESPYDGTIAHGFLTLALVSYFSGQAIRLRAGVGIRVNYGLNRVRFPSAVRAGSAIRARVTLLSVTESAALVDITFSVTIESQRTEKLCCIAEWLVRYYRA